MDQDSPPSDIDIKRQPLPRNVKLLGAASFLNDIASEIIAPLLPFFLTVTLGGTKFWLGVIEGAAESISSLLKLYSGALSDRLGRRRELVIFGYSLAAIARPLMGFAGTAWHVLAIRLGDRVGKGIRTSPRDALIADSTDPAIRGRAFGFHRAMDHLGAAIGPVLATVFLLVWPDQLRLLFCFTLFPGVLVVLLLVFGLQEYRKPKEEKPPAEKETEQPGPPPQDMPLDRNFRVFMFAIILFTLGNASDAFLLVRATELGVPIAWLPILWCGFHIVKSLCNLLAGRASDRFGAKRMLVIGWMAYAASYLSFALVTSAIWFWLFFFVYGFFYSISEPAEKAMTAALAGRNRQGRAFGWFNFSIGIAALPSSLLFGLIYQKFGALAAFGWGAVLALLAATCLIGVRQIPKTLPEKRR